MAQTDPVTGERLISVPGKGNVTESVFRQMVQNNEIAAGPGGSAEQNALNTGSYYAPQDASSSGTPSSGTAAPSSASTPTGANGSGVAGARNENVYGLRPNDDPTSWAKRAFAQGTADYGPSSSNPYLDQNPLANSPWAQWYQQRYGVAVPTNALVADQIAGTAPTGDTMQAQMQAAQNGGQGGPNIAGATSNLQAVNNMVKQQMAGGGSNNTTQRLFAGQLLNDPQLASQIITSQLQSGTGGWGMGYLGNELSNLATHYYNDPSNQGPQSANGSFLNQAMKMMGMA